MSSVSHTRFLHPAGFRSRLVSIAKGQVGKREVGNNGGLAVRSYQSATWLEPGAWPWCAAFVCWCYQVAALGSPECSRRRPTTPRAFEFEPWGRKHAQVLKPAAGVLPGDIVVFQFPTGGHVGIAVTASKDGEFSTVEGNTNPAGSREGDGVYQRKRNFAFVRSIIRLHESAPETATTR